MKKLLLLVGLVFLIGNVAFAAPSPNPLEGKTFVGQMGKTGDKKGDPDNFEFKSGHFHSTACDEFGYKEAPVTVNSTKDAVHFESTTQNDKGAKMSWKGTLKGNKIEGTAVMTTASGEVGDQFWFHGHLKK